MTEHLIGFGYLKAIRGVFRDIGPNWAAIRIETTSGRRDFGQGHQRSEAACVVVEQFVQMPADVIAGAQQPGVRTYPPRQDTGVRQQAHSELCFNGIRQVEQIHIRKEESTVPLRILPVIPATHNRRLHIRQIVIPQ